MYLECFALSISLMAAFAGHCMGAEIASELLWDWHEGYVKKLKPITDAYRRFKQRQSETETKEGVS